MRLRTAFIVGILGLLAVLLWRNGADRPNPAAPAPAPSHDQAGAGAPASTQAAAPAESQSELTKGLNDPKGDIKADLRILNSLFVAYRGATRQQNPVGENSEITAALRGRNRLGFAFVPSDCPALNGKGELCDRWGTPFFFHQLSGERMEIRSAGPDKKLWTADDQVLTP